MKKIVKLSFKRIYHFIDKILKPGFFVCSFEHELGKESGSFAALGDDEAKAMQDACSHIKATAYYSGNVYVTIRKPTFLEKLKHAL